MFKAIPEGRRWLDMSIKDTTVLQPSLRAKALTGAARLALDQRDYQRGRALLEESLVLARAAGDTGTLAWVLNDLGWLADEQGDYVGATALHEESLALFRALGDRRGMASALYNLAVQALSTTTLIM